MAVGITITRQDESAAPLRRMTATVAADCSPSFGSTSARVRRRLSPRWDGITLDHRVTYAGQAYEIRDLAEIGRRNGLTITARRFEP